ncbi:hypothetical protein H3V53_21250 [Paraburkholderia bengalensis]|uniref:Uncharacterized protein n=1 Tax=Paraburkholderia bengalensis TaxID=2747562 RepID=A0ABU8IW61_9BURK
MAFTLPRRLLTMLSNRSGARWYRLLNSAQIRAWIDAKSRHGVSSGIYRSFDRYRQNPGFVIL